MTPQEIKQELKNLPSQVIVKWGGNPDFTIIHTDSVNYDQGLVKVSLLGNEAHYIDGNLVTLLYA